MAEFKKLGAVEAVETASDTASVLIEENGVIKRAPKDEIGGGIKVASTAKVGQTIVVKAVDENGNPTEWECADKGDQADWNENDETSMAYIQNRPFYETVTETVVIESQTVNLTVSGSYANGSLTYVNYIPWDGICKVIFDGVIYDNIEAYEGGADMCVYIDFTTEDGERISICESNSISGPASLAGQHTIEVFIKGIDIKTLDNKFISLPASMKSGTGPNSLMVGNVAGASGDASYAQGMGTNASGMASHAEGFCSDARGTGAHAEGQYTSAWGLGSHAEGNSSKAISYGSHAEGNETTATGESSHAEGNGTTASHKSQHVEGEYNIIDPSSNNASSRGTYAHVVGNGTSSSERSNAHTLDWNGNAWYQGTVEGTAMIVKSSTSGSTKRFKITVDDSGTITATKISD